MKEGETVSGVDFQLKRAINFIGTLLTPEGKPIPGVLVYVEWPHRPFPVLTDRNGRFVVEDVAPGERIYLSMEHPELNLRLNWIDIIVQPEGEISFSLKPTGRKRGDGSRGCDVGEEEAYEVGAHPLGNFEVFDQRGANLQGCLKVSETSCKGVRPCAPTGKR